MRSDVEHLAQTSLAAPSNHSDRSLGRLPDQFRSSEKKPLAGGVGVVFAARAFRRPILGDTVDELERTAIALAPERVSGAIAESRHDA